MNIPHAFQDSWINWLSAATWQLTLLFCIVSALCWLARNASPRLRYGLWMLVLVKCFLPPFLSMPGSLGGWGIRPLVRAAEFTQLKVELPRVSIQTHPGPATSTESEAGPITPAARPWVPLFVVWACGCLGFWLVVAWQYSGVLRGLRSANSIDEGPVRVDYERIAMRLNLHSVPELLATEMVTSPFLFGVVRPRIVLPGALLQNFDREVLSAVLMHELVHWQRRAPWVGWLQAAAQSLFWFHPCVWWANRQLSHARECACDEAVLRSGQFTPERYGQSIIHVLTSLRGRPLVAGNLVGVLERTARLQNRLEEIMSFEATQREFGWVCRLAITVCAMVLLPMSPGTIELPVVVAEEPVKTAKVPTPAKTPYPQIVSTAPERGAAGVDPGLREITVTFDRDMQAGMSWTGGPPLFPPTDKNRKARWVDARTCVLPVQVEKGTFYRVGINASSFQNFRSRDGVPAPSSAIWFVTAGRSQELETRLAVPKIIKIEPEIDARDVDPATSALQVTFNVVMGTGMSWAGGKQFPKSPQGQAARWSEDGLTCALPVSLEPNREYVISLNSLQHNNFQSKWGVPLEPVIYKFRTRGKE